MESINIHEIIVNKETQKKTTYETKRVTCSDLN